MEEKADDLWGTSGADGVAEIVATGTATVPGRFDVMGGVSDYSGALVLQTAIAGLRGTTVSVRVLMAKAEERRMLHLISHDGFGEHNVGWDDLLDGCRCDGGDVDDDVGERALASVRHHVVDHNGPEQREADASVINWAGLAFAYHIAVGGFPREGEYLEIACKSDLPIGEGVASSASFAVATLWALDEAYGACPGSAGSSLDALSIARLAQRVENIVARSPCGLMDQIACIRGANAPGGTLIPIDCLDPERVHVPVALPRAQTLRQGCAPSDVIVVGIPSGVEHSNAGGTSPYLKARTATAMGRQIMDKLTSKGLNGEEEARRLRTPPSRVSPWEHAQGAGWHLPKGMTGGAFHVDHGPLDNDPFARVDPTETYPVRAAMAFASEAHFHASLAHHLLEGIDARQASGSKVHAVLCDVGQLMLAQHRAYSAIGVGHERTDALVRQLMDAGPVRGIYGARVSGGGAGGTCVVLCSKDAMPLLEEFANAFGSKVIV